MAIKLEKTSHNVSESTCIRNFGHYKLYADHFNCASPYTNYYIADTETGEVAAYKEHPSYLKSAVAELVKQVSEYGFQDVPEPRANTSAFDPLAW